MGGGPEEVWAFYGVVDWTRADVRGQPTLSVDLRAETGAPLGTPDESCVLPAGSVVLSVCGHSEPGVLPIGEIRIWWNGREVRIVGAPTARPGVIELTPDHLRAAREDRGYRDQVLGWLAAV